MTETKENWVAAILRMKKEGHDVFYIARKLGIAVDTVKAICK